MSSKLASKFTLHMHTKFATQFSNTTLLRISHLNSLPITFKTHNKVLLEVLLVNTNKKKKSCTDEKAAPQSPKILNLHQENTGGRTGVSLVSESASPNKTLALHVTRKLSGSCWSRWDLPQGAARERTGVCPPWSRGWPDLWPASPTWWSASLRCQLALWHEFEMCWCQPLHLEKKKERNKKTLKAVLLNKKR